MRIVAFISLWILAGNFLAAAESTSIIYLRPADALNLNPWQAEDSFSNEIAANIFEGLVRFKKTPRPSNPVWPRRGTSRKTASAGASSCAAASNSMTTALSTPRPSSIRFRDGWENSRSFTND